MEDIILNIQPQASIYSVFSRLSYKPWYAIAEFVDNSTASFYGHKKILSENNINIVHIDIQYDSFLKTLTITDDAFGMNLEDFKRAILLDSKPDNLNKRNEFGMGLKTAASWFGNFWSVKSTAFGSNKMYYASIDINVLKEKQINETLINVTDADIKDHGTVIKIERITKEISSKVINNIKSVLASMYRRDINSGLVEITFNGEKLFFTNFPILKYKGKEWKKDVNFSFVFNGKNYNVKGFVGIMEKGSFLKAGFALFRFDRVIKGVTDMNYKPLAIFKEAQSQISLKLFGELDLDDFPVNQAKDGFIWDDGLEDAFLMNLKENIKDYIKIADLSKKERASEESNSSENAKIIESNVSSALTPLLKNYEDKDETFDSEEVNSFNKEMSESNKTVDKLLSDSCREYSLPLNEFKTITFKVYWKISNNFKWLEYDRDNNNIYININHPFFKPYSERNEFKELLDKFVICLIYSEEICLENNITDNEKNGFINADLFLIKINEFLGKVK